MLALTEAVWPASLAEFRSCGRGRSECVVYWLGPLHDATVIDVAVHPEHSSTPWMYQVQDSWLSAFMVRLHTERRTVRVQVHTHCGAAFHSQTDDEWPLVTTPGFLSLVVPRFAMGPIRRDELYLAELNSTSGWDRVVIEKRIKGLP